MLRVLERLHREDEGQDIIEYAILAALISVVAILIVKAIGETVNDLFTNVNSDLNQP